MNSRLCLGSTYHKRTFPIKHGFRYKTFQFLLDLDELEFLSKYLRFFSYNDPGFYSFLDSDHCLKGEKSLRESIEKQVKAKHPGFQIERIYLLGNLRTYGHIFNPVCFYLILDGANRALVLTEVMNTFFEHKTYLSNIAKVEKNKVKLTERFDKAFYISPYSSSKGELEYKFEVDLEKFVNIQVFNYEKGRMTVYADIVGKLETINDRALLKSMVRYPLETMSVVFLIHWQALLLFLRKLKFYTKEEEIEFQQGVDVWKKQY